MKKMKIALIALTLISAVWYSGCVSQREAKDCLINEGRPYNLSPEEEKILEKIQKASQEAKQSPFQNKTMVMSPVKHNNRPYRKKHDLIK